MPREFVVNKSFIPADKIPTVSFNAADTIYDLQENKILIESPIKDGGLEILKKITCWIDAIDLEETFERKTAIMLCPESKRENFPNKLYELFPQVIRERVELIERQVLGQRHGTKVITLFLLPKEIEPFLDQLLVISEKIYPHEELYAELFNLIQQIKGNLQWQRVALEHQLVSEQDQYLLDQLRQDIWISMKELMASGKVDSPRKQEKRSYIHEISHFVQHQIKWLGIVSKIRIPGFLVLQQLQYLSYGALKEGIESLEIRAQAQERLYHLFALNNFIRALGESVSIIHELLGVLVIDESDNSTYAHIELLDRMISFLSLFNCIRGSNSLELDGVINIKFKQGMIYDPIDVHNLGVFFMLIADNVYLLKMSETLNSLDALCTNREDLIGQLIEKMRVLVKSEEYARCYLLSIYDPILSLLSRVIDQYISEFTAFFSDLPMFREQLSSDGTNFLNDFESLLAQLNLTDKTDY